MRLLAAAIAAATLAGGTTHAGGGSLIVFAADRAPALSGDLYRADANGHVANLTHSPWQETNPHVSPNGKLVAFASDENGGTLWTIGIDGRGLRRIAARGLPSQYLPEIAWSPDSRELVYTTGGSATNVQTLWLVRLGGAATAIERDKSLFRPSWSPDGRLVTVATKGAVDALSPAGKHIWSVSSGGAVVGWSSRGLFATGAYDGHVHVVDERGAERFRVAASSAAWSPDGTKLATTKGHRGSVYTSAGRLVSSELVAVADAQPVWTSATHVAFGSPSSVGPNTVRTGTTFAVRNGTRVYTHVIGCDDDGGPVAAIASLQPVPHSTSIVYQSYCAEPYDNLYSIASDGTRLHRITNAQKQQMEPTISPDGTHLAFSQSDYTGLSCKGCPSSLHTMRLDGSGDLALTYPPDCTFDASSSWSPDGTQIAISHSGCDAAPDAMAVPASGGTPKDLHLPGFILAWGPARIAYVDGALAWSPDGRLAFLARTTVTIVPGGKVPLPFAQVRSLAWSPDGTRFLVAAKAKGTPAFDLYSVRTDGTGVQRLTSDMDVSGGDWR